MNIELKNFLENVLQDKTYLYHKKYNSLALSKEQIIITYNNEQKNICIVETDNPIYFNEVQYKNLQTIFNLLKIEWQKNELNFKNYAKCFLCNNYANYLYKIDEENKFIIVDQTNLLNNNFTVKDLKPNEFTYRCLSHRIIETIGVF